MLLKLVRIFGSVIRSTLSASSSVGVDIQAEQRLVWLQLHIWNFLLFWFLYIIISHNWSHCYLMLGCQRLERCNLCFIELEKIKRCLPALTRCIFTSLKLVCLFIWFAAISNLNWIILVFAISVITILFFHRRGGSVAKSAQELNLALLEVLWVCGNYWWLFVD